MTLSIRMIWGLVAVVGVAATGPIAWRWARSTGEADAHTRRLARLTTKAQELGSLYAGLPGWAAESSGKAAGPLAPQVSAALSASGLPASAMASLSADSGGAPEGATPVLRKRATLVLASVTLPQLGTFLQNWRQRQPAWTVSQIDVTPEAGGAAAKAATGGDLPLRAVLVLESLSLDQSRGVR